MVKLGWDLPAMSAADALALAAATPMHARAERPAVCG